MIEKMNEDTLLLKIENLYVEYSSEQEKVKAVNGVSFDLKAGQTLGLVGETGAGKTSIAKAILRILPDPPAKITSGEIIYEGANLRNIPEAEMRKIRGSKISMIFQDPMTALNPVLTVGFQISETIRIHQSISSAEAVTAGKKMLEMVGIPASRYDDYPHQFSGGMKQRVVIAIALACSPSLLIADEPTTALDVTIQAQVLNLIHDLQVQKQMAMILITHDFGIVAESCDFIAVIYAGEIVEKGTIRQVFKHPSHPYTKGLFGAIPSLTGSVERLHNIEGSPCDPTDLPDGCKFSPRCQYACDACRKKGQIPMENLGEGHMCRCLKAKEFYDSYGRR